MQLQGKHAEDPVACSVLSLANGYRAKQTVCYYSEISLVIIRNEVYNKYGAVTKVQWANTVVNFEIVYTCSDESYFDNEKKYTVVDLVSSVEGFKRRFHFFGPLISLGVEKQLHRFYLEEVAFDQFIRNLR